MPKEVLLVSVGDENEANIIQNLLETHKIPSLRKYRDIGGYMKVYMGTSAFGIDIFVPESCVEASREILGNVNRTADNTNLDNTVFDETLSEVQGQTQFSFDPEEKKNFTRWLLLFILIPLAAGILASISVFFL